MATKHDQLITRLGLSFTPTDAAWQANCSEWDLEFLQLKALDGLLDGGITVSATTAVKATAAAPTYVEGTTSNPLSANLTGDVRVIAKQPAVTPHIVVLDAEETQVIPIGAKGWTFSVLTGTATVNGETVPAGFSDSDSQPLAATITVITAAASSAYIRWNT